MTEAANADGDYLRFYENSFTIDEGGDAETLERALLAAQMGDYSLLNAMGIDTSNNPTDWERQYTLAVLAAELGDYSLLEKLGVTPTI